MISAQDIQYDQLYHIIEEWLLNTQARPASLAPSGQNLPSARRQHSPTETVSTFTHAMRRGLYVFFHRK